jgi:3-isopropylmalate dehydratase small subunit
MEKITGRIFVLGDDIDTDQILPGYAMAEPLEQLSQYAMAGTPGLNFQELVQTGDIIVAGRNFGCGSSREQAPLALKMSGVSLIVAKSFARIFRRNAINIGLPVYVADIADSLKTGESITVDLVQGQIELAAGIIKSAPISENTRITLEYGGLIPRVRAELNS